MGWWQINADTLAGGRFLVSPLAETIASLKTLERGEGAHPGERRWLGDHLAAYRGRQAADPVSALLIRAALGRTWNADFLTPTPTGAEEVSFDEEVARLRATPPAAARAHLTVSLGGPLPTRLHREDLPERAAEVLTWVWRETVLPYWPRRLRILEADMVARTAQLSRGGWAAALGALRPGMRWLGENRLQINTHDYPPRDLSGVQLMFVPVTPRTGWVSWEAPGSARPPATPAPGAPGPAGHAVPSGRPVGSAVVPPHRYAVVYPCSGALADAGRRPAVPRALGRLLGPARARVLVLLDSPKSTTQLVALTGQGLGSVGRHLRVLLDAGLAGRRRAGRSVLYYRTAAGEVVVGARPDEPDEPDDPAGATG